MKLKKTITSVALLLLGLGGLKAQETITTTGGAATGTGGTASYTIGQIAYAINTGTNGSLAQGVQQAYEISVTTGINDANINLALSVYPNPTANYLTLKVEDNTNLSYLLLDMQGNVIENKNVVDNSTIVKMEGLPAATYFLNIVKNNIPVKIFKIIKN